jgi:hypothetical protein
MAVKPYTKAKPKILIGQDNLNLIAMREIIEIKKTDMMFSPLLLGWALHRSLQHVKETTRATLYTMNIDLVNYGGNTQIENQDTGLDELMKHYFDMENIDVNDTGKTKYHDSQAEQELNEISKRIGKIWEVGLLQKREYASTNNTFRTASKSIITLEHWLDRDSNYAKLYNRKMQRFIDLGVAVINIYMC